MRGWAIQALAGNVLSNLRVAPVECRTSHSVHSGGFFSSPENIVSVGAGMHRRLLINYVWRTIGKVDNIRGCTAYLLLAIKIDGALSVGPQPGHGKDPSYSTGGLIHKWSQ